MILAIDQGTTGTMCLVVDDQLAVRGRGYRKLTQHFPRPGWVEHEPEEIWSTVLDAAQAAVASAGIAPRSLNAVAISNQRETTLLWERRSGRPVQRAIVWQDRRTAERCGELPRDLIRTRTGLVPDPYFSATKLEWLLRQTDQRLSDLAFGTVDSWLLWRLTGGRVHATDYTNASRTMLLALDRLEWDTELLSLFGVDAELLPELRPSSSIFGETILLGETLPIAGMAGDQQAALFGQACFQPGQAKATYGTGSFVLMNVGDSGAEAPEGLLKTAAVVVERQYAFEGAVLASGAAIQWLRDGLGLFASAEESERLARAVDSSEGVYFVPALTGLGSPHWNPRARGVIGGLTLGTTRAHLVRAALEAIAFQVADVVEQIPFDLAVLRADGGGSVNRFLMQFQADVLGRPVEVAAERETTALGAAALAGLAVGAFSHIGAMEESWRCGARYEPDAQFENLAELKAGWRTAIERACL